MSALTQDAGGRRVVLDIPADGKPGAPPPDKVVEGNPTFRTFAGYKSLDGTLQAGQWEATPGTWRIAYTRWEWMRLHSGRCVIRDEDGQEWRLGPGDVFVIEPGFKGTWQVLETMRKDYVIRT